MTIAIRRTLAAVALAATAGVVPLVGQAPATPPDSGPATLRYKGITFTPGGFLAGESVYRTHGLGSDINTPFNSIPFPGSSQNDLSEFNATGRQSRLSLLAQGKPGNAKLTGYFEMDFLSAGVTSNDNQSNSYTMRYRQAWAQASTSGITFSAGQMWSLATERKKALDLRTEAAPLTIDAQYNVGFSWARQYAARLVATLSKQASFGIAAEAAQTIIGASGSPTYLVGTVGTGGGLYNLNANYSANEAPDLVAKLALDPGWGHFEVFGLLRFFRDRIFPCATTAAGVMCDGVTGPSAAGANNVSTTGSGAGANLRVPLGPLDLGVHFLGGNGVGRYGTTGLPDVTTALDGSLATLENYQALVSLELHLKQADIYAYGGEEYAGKQAYTTAAGKGEGYGSPLFADGGCAIETLPTGNYVPGALGNCVGQTRYIEELTLGFWHRLTKSSKGTLQWGLQYSYVARFTWAGVGATAGSTALPVAIDNMILTSFRYVFP